MEADEKHHHMFRKSVEGVTHLVTRISHSAREIDDHNGGLMAKQLALRLGEFWQLVDCPLTSEQWEALVKERCQGGHNPFLGR